MEAKTKSGSEWAGFSNEVLYHIENYAVPQYGDAGGDMAHNYGTEALETQIEKYVGRFKHNARGITEKQRDLLKICHYACILFMKQERLMMDAGSPSFRKRAYSK